VARIPLVDPEDPGLDSSVRRRLTASTESLIGVPNVLRALANHPGLLGGFGHVVYSPDALITPAQRELAYLTASVTNSCHYWVPAHILLGRSVGLSNEKMSHLGDDPLPDELFSPEEAAIVRYAQASTLMRPITHEMYADLSRHFDTKRIMELWATVSLSNQVNRFHATFLTDVDDTIVDSLGSSCPLRIPLRPGDE
jgi:AhpD family alkylhydroperoxidase